MYTVRNEYKLRRMKSVKNRFVKPWNKKFFCEVSSEVDSLLKVFSQVYLSIKVLTFYTNVFFMAFQTSNLDIQPKYVI